MKHKKINSEIGFARALEIRKRYLEEEITATELAKSVGLERRIVMDVLKNWSYRQKDMGNIYVGRDELRRKAKLSPVQESKADRIARTRNDVRQRFIAGGITVSDLSKEYKLLRYQVIEILRGQEGEDNLISNYNY